jgi:hypothetical protein
LGRRGDRKKQKYSRTQSRHGSAILASDWLAPKQLSCGLGLCHLRGGLR